MAKKLTKNQDEYNKQVKRIKAFKRRAEKRGFDIVLPDFVQKKPKRITNKVIERLKELTPTRLYHMSTYKGKSGWERRKEEIKEAAQKRKETIAKKKNVVTATQEKENKKASDKEKLEEQEQQKGYIWRIIVANYKANLEQFNDPKTEKAIDALLKWIDDLIKDYGITAVGKMLQEGAAKGVIVTYRTLYNPEELADYLVKMMNFLPINSFTRDSLIDAVENGSYVSEAFYYE